LRLLRKRARPAIGGQAAHEGRGAAQSVAQQRVAWQGTASRRAEKSHSFRRNIKTLHCVVMRCAEARCAERRGIAWRSGAQRRAAMRGVGNHSPFRRNNSSVPSMTASTVLLLEAVSAILWRRARLAAFLISANCVALVTCVSLPTASSALNATA